MEDDDRQYGAQGIAEDVVSGIFGDVLPVNPPDLGLEEHIRKRLEAFPKDAGQKRPAKHLSEPLW